MNRSQDPSSWTANNQRKLGRKLKRETGYRFTIGLFIFATPDRALITFETRQTLAAAHSSSMDASWSKTPKNTKKNEFKRR